MLELTKDDIIFLCNILKTYTDDTVSIENERYYNKLIEKLEKLL